MPQGGFRLRAYAGWMAFDRKERPMIRTYTLRAAAALGHVRAVRVPPHGRQDDAGRALARQQHTVDRVDS